MYEAHSFKKNSHLASRHRPPRHPCFFLSASTTTSRWRRAVTTSPSPSMPSSPTCSGRSSCAPPPYVGTVNPPLCRSTLSPSGSRTATSWRAPRRGRGRRPGFCSPLSSLCYGGAGLRFVFRVCLTFTLFDDCGTFGDWIFFCSAGTNRI